MIEETRSESVVGFDANDGVPGFLVERLELGFGLVDRGRLHSPSWDRRGSFGRLLLCVSRQWRRQRRNQGHHRKQAAEQFDEQHETTPFRGPSLVSCLPRSRENRTAPLSQRVPTSSIFFTAKNAKGARSAKNLYFSIAHDDLLAFEEPSTLKCTINR